MTERRRLQADGRPRVQRLIVGLGNDLGHISGGQPAVARRCAVRRDEPTARRRDGTLVLARRVERERIGCVRDVGAFLRDVGHGRRRERADALRRGEKLHPTLHGPVLSEHVERHADQAQIAQRQSVAGHRWLRQQQALEQRSGDAGAACCRECHPLRLKHHGGVDPAHFRGQFIGRICDRFEVLLVRSVAGRTWEKHADAAYQHAVLIQWNAARQSGDAARHARREQATLHAIRFRVRQRNRQSGFRVQRRIRQIRGGDVQACAVGLLDPKQVHLRGVKHAGRKVIAQSDRRHITRTGKRRSGRQIRVRLHFALRDRRLADEFNCTRRERRAGGNARIATAGEERAGAGQRDGAVDRIDHRRLICDRHTRFDPHSQDVARAIDNGDDRVAVDRCVFRRIEQTLYVRGRNRRHDRRRNTGRRHNQRGRDRRRHRRNHFHGRQRGAAAQDDAGFQTLDPQRAFAANRTAVGRWHRRLGARGWECSMARPSAPRF